MVSFSSAGLEVLGLGLGVVLVEMVLPSSLDALRSHLRPAEASTPPRAVRSSSAHQRLVHRREPVPPVSVDRQRPCGRRALTIVAGR